MPTPSGLDLTQLGIGAIFVLLVLDKLFVFLKPILAKRNHTKSGGNAKAGERSVEFWEARQREIVRIELDAMSQILDARLASVLDELKDMRVRHLHAIGNSLQTLTVSLPFFVKNLEAPAADLKGATTDLRDVAAELRRGRQRG